MQDKKNRSGSSEKVFYCRKYKENSGNGMALSLMSVKCQNGKQKLEQLEVKLNSNKKNNKKLQDSVLKLSDKQFLGKNTDLTIKQIASALKNLKEDDIIKNQMVNKYEAIQNMRKHSFIKALIKIRTQKKSINDKVQNLLYEKKSQLNINRQTQVFKNLKENHDIKIQLVEKYESIQNIMKKRFINKLRKQKMENKAINDKVVNLLLEKNPKLSSKQINTVFKNLKESHNMKNQLTEKCQAIHNVRKKRLIKALVKSALQRKNINDKIIKFREQGLLFVKSRIFNILLAQKQVKLQQKSIINKIISVYVKKQLSISFNKLCKAAKINKNLSILCQRTQKIILKSSFYKTFRKSFVINKQVQKMKKQNMLRSLDYLFSTLKQISIHSKGLKQQVKKILLNSMQVTLISKLKRNSKINLLKSKVQKLHQTQQQKLFFRCLLQKKFIEQCQNKKIRKILVFLFLNNLSNKNIQKQQKKSDLEKKSSKLKCFIKNHQIYTFGKKLMALRDHKYAKKQLAQFIIDRTQLKALDTIVKNSNEFREHNETTIQRKSIQVKRIHFKKLLNYLILTINQSKTQLMVQKTVKKQFFRNITQNYNENCQKKYCRVVFGINMIKKQIKRNKLNAQIEQQEKDKLQQLKKLQKRHLLKKAQFLFDTLMIHKQLKNKTMTIQKKLKNKNTMHFIKQSFHYKNKKILMKIAIIHYARRLKQKVINALYQKDHQQKQKQNSLRKYRNQEGLLKMEKILEKSRRSNKLSDKISRFNMNISRSRRVMR